MPEAIRAGDEVQNEEAPAANGPDEPTHAVHM